MIIAKKLDSVSGNVEYSVNFKGYSESEELLEYEKFSNIKELTDALSESKLKDIKDHYEADNVFVTSVSFNGHSEDKETSSRFFLTEDGVSGGVSAKIDNEDIDNRLLMNIQNIKRLIDNTLEQYPVKY
ncbi:hypothetical protein [Paenibacillus sp. QZ-Y1]|uniref:hypothetical protein n=1 Tax=Paenibacillus sp. QZ-Y1 TaxID=3414511 RepID=UPI003F7B0CCF